MCLVLHAARYIVCAWCELVPVLASPWNGHAAGVVRKLLACKEEKPAPGRGRGPSRRCLQAFTSGIAALSPAGTGA
jgi:hypothetical protein